MVESKFKGRIPQNVKRQKPGEIVKNCGLKCSTKQAQIVELNPSGRRTLLALSAYLLIWISAIASARAEAAITLSAPETACLGGEISVSVTLQADCDEDPISVSVSGGGQ